MNIRITLLLHVVMMKGYWQVYLAVAPNFYATEERKSGGAVLRSKSG